MVAPLGELAGVDRALILTAWRAAGGWLSLVLPTDALGMAGLAPARVGFDQDLHFMLPLRAILVVVVLVVLVVLAIVTLA